MTLNSVFKKSDTFQSGYCQHWQFSKNTSMPVLHNAMPDSKSDLCVPCSGVQQHWRRAPGHAELVQGTHRKEDRGHGPATITNYVCDRCGTAWEYENNKSNLHAGWSVVRR